MTSLFAFGPYIIFFWTGEQGEPIHVHVSVKRPSKDATKLWLTASGGCLVAHNNSQLPERDLRRWRSSSARTTSSSAGDGARRSERTRCISTSKAYRPRRVTACP